MTDYDIEKVSPRPWKVVWDLSMTLHRSDYYERLQFATKSERDAREAEWNENHEEQASRGYWIADANGDIVEYGMLYSSYGFRVSEADVEHTVRCVNKHEALEQAGNFIEANEELGITVVELQTLLIKCPGVLENAMIYYDMAVKEASTSQSRENYMKDRKVMKTLLYSILAACKPLKKKESND